MLSLEPDWGSPKSDKGSDKSARGHMDHREGHHSWMLVFWGRPLGHPSGTKGHISHRETGATGSVERATNGEDENLGTVTFLSFRA